MSGDTSSVQVAVRVRPMLASEAGSTPCVEVLQSSPELPANVIRIGGVDGPTFAFDQAFDGNCQQSHVFDQCVVPLVEQVLEGYNATILAYGQTGSGKTYSVMGPSTALQDGATAGIIPRAMRNLFRLLRERKEASVESRDDAAMESSDSDDSPFGYEIRVQFLELYGEEIRDLLTAQATAQRLTVRDVGMEEPEVLGATQHKVETAEEALLCLTRGMLRRVTGETAMNASSSRSHAIMSVMVQQTAKHGDNNNDQLTEVKRSKFNFVDLAGSERQKRTKAEGRRLKEGIDINRGLLVLGNVISALGDPKRHGTFVPYRDSKLTRLLKGSLGGNHKTLMIACVSPSSNNLDESLNCLRYANRAKNIQNKAIVNVDAGSRLVAELRGQVQALATELLRVREGGDHSDEPFSIDVLRSLVGEGKVEGGGVFTPIASSSSTQQAFVTPSTSSAQQPFQPIASLDLQQQLHDVKRALTAAQAELQSTTEDLFTVRAEKEMYRLRLDARGADSGEGVEAAFVEKAAAYEREIATLRQAVASNTDPVVAQATLSIAKDRERLRKLQDAASTPPVKPKHVPVVNEREPGEQLDLEEKAEQEEIGTITRKFLDDDEFDEHALEITKETGSTEASHDIRQQQIEASLSDLSRSIDEKELLIKQLQTSKERYASMKEFYEAKLAEMEEQVREREKEREALVAELEKLEQSNSDTKEMQEKLSRKDNQIAGLRKRQKELTSLTKVSSRNEQQISRLRDEVAAMKQKKVELQKMVTQDRRDHLKEIQRLKKEAMRKDREAVKWKRVSDKKEREAEKAQQFARAQTAQVGQLRAKYKEAERKLRVRTVKRGVMAKAGLDAVIVGRRNKPASARSKQSRGQSSHQGSPGKKAEIDVDAMRDFLDQQVSVIGRKESLADKLANEWEDHMDLVDQKETLLQDASNNDESNEADASVEAIDVKLRYKEARIRQLAARLGKKQNDGDGKASKDATNFLDIREFRALFPGVPQMEATRLACRVLFGMVVRERRRVASLARTASGLDAKILEAQRASVAKDAAMRAYMEEERHERATLAQSQQEQILSLMALVQEQEATPETENAEASSPGDRDVTSSVMILANERIEALEKALREHEGERKAMQLYKEREEEAVAALEAVQDDCQKLHVNMDSLVISMRSIREAVLSSTSEQGSEEFSGLKVLGIISRALKATKVSMEERDLMIQASNTDLTPSPCLTHRSEVLQSDSEDDEVEEEIPEWAGDIMADLQTIADGGVPQSLLESPSFRDFDEQERERSSNSVFDRLTNPENFTGVQKRKTASMRQQRNSRVKPGSNERKEMAKKIEKSLDKVALPPDMKSSSEDGKRDATAVKEKPKSKPKSSSSPADSGDRRSVFERLLSPSAYTGTQKERIKSTQPRHDVGAMGVQDDASKVDDLLDELLGREHGSDVFPSDRHSEPSITSQVESKMADYTQQNVFERLQRTTTQAYAGKHGGATIRTISSPARSQGSSHVELGPHDPARSISPQVPDYIRQNVFERLQKTTTQAYAQKSNHGTSS